MNCLPELLKPKEACEALSISYDTLRKLVKSKELRATRIGPKSLRIYRDSVLSLVERGKVDALPE